MQWIPCGMSLAELEASLRTRGPRCHVAPGPVQFRSPACDRGCVQVGVSDETWSDMGARAALLATLKNPELICRYAELYANNHRASAAGAGCGRSSLFARHIAVAVTRRVRNPCTHTPLRRPGSFAVRCNAVVLRVVRIT